MRCSTFSAPGLPSAPATSKQGKNESTYLLILVQIHWVQRGELLVHINSNQLKYLKTFINIPSVHWQTCFLVLPAGGGIVCRNAGDVQSAITLQKDIRR